MLRGISEKMRWRAVIAGWAVAIATGIVVNLLFEVAHVWLFGGKALDTSNPTTAVVTISLISGFLAHFAGGYVAGRKARVFGGLHGVMVAILGFLFVVIAVVVVTAIAVATAGIFLIEGRLPLPSLTLGFAGGALLASMVLLVLNILGAFLGGKLGEWETRAIGAPGGESLPPE